MTAQYRKCGKPCCKVCSEGRGHGPYYYGTRVVDGKKEISDFGRKTPEPAPQAIQASIQGHGESPTSLTLDDHIHSHHRVRGLVHALPLATYLVKSGRSAFHIHDIQFADFYYHQYQAEIRMDVHTANGGKHSFLLRGIDVVKLAMWLKEHARPPKRPCHEA